METINVANKMERRSSTNSESSIEPNEISSLNKTLSSDANSSIVLKNSHESDTVESDENEDYLNNNTCNNNNNKNNTNNNKDTKNNISDNDIVRRDNLRQLMDKMLQKKIMNAEKINNYGNSHTETSLDLSGNCNNESKPITQTTNTTSSADSLKYVCPICDEISLTQHEFTTHIRNHNNVRDSSDDSSTFTCRICSKILSSASSLDRHVLVHTGERPFTCKYCHLTFTTNGNMHRHMRTHKQHDNKMESYESDASTDSSVSSGAGSRKIIKSHLLNNNFPHKRKSTDEELSVNHHKRKNRALSFNSNNNVTSPQHHPQQKFCCPVCERNNFSNMIDLEDHMDKEHPTIPAKCRHCEVVFKSHKALNAHRCGNQKSSMNVTQGFKDLTYLDFSSTKFPVIAKTVCEQSIRTPITNQKFECPKCFRAFPCASSVEIHIKECDSFAHDFSAKRQRQMSENSEEDVKREDFFANLALQNRSMGTSGSEAPSTPEKSFSSGMLLKDIKQEIRSTPPYYPFFNENRDFADIESIIKATSSGGLDKPIPEKDQHLYNKEEEEAQDAFTMEFRKMKMRGEFPCRLCTMVFPNLRALKGHNRVHLSAAGPGPYRCNMCPHSINDKAALIRHMRTHNGDRPYECSLCNYAFTTKANCERHLRNRHGKSTREEVKRSIIYHPSEDSSCDDHTKKIQMFNTPSYERDRLSVTSSMDEHPKDRSTPVSHLKEMLNSQESSSPQMRIQVKSLEKLNNFQEENNEIEERREHKPMDLSMDALDLSKKPNAFNHHHDDGLSEEEDQDEEENMDDSEERMPEIPKFDLSSLKEHPLFMMQQPFFNEALTKLDATQYFQLAQMYRAFGFPTPGFPIHPALLLQNPLMATSAINDMKSLFQKEMTPPTPPQTSISGAMSGGSLIVNPFVSPDSSPTGPNSQGLRNMEHSPVPNNHISIPPFPPTPQESPKKVPTPNHPPLTPQSIQSHNGPVKMVIKNGVLMPKQKQRRYRTERPFACEHCSARFTLRSNMERHIKQQHPQFWAQRQRGSHNLLRRATPQPMANTMMPTLTNSTFGGISEQVKYAILAQQLKSRESPKNLLSQFPHPTPSLGIPPPHSPHLNHNEIQASPKSHTPAINDDDDPKLVIDEEYQAEDLSKSSDSVNDNEKTTAARKVAEGILEEAMKINSNTKTVDMREMKNFEAQQDEDDIDDEDEEQPKNDEAPPAIKEEANDLVSVSKLVDNATNSMMFSNYFSRPEPPHPDHSDEEGLVASGSASESNNSGTDDPNPSSQAVQKKKSAYSLAPNRVSCPYCQRKFPWSSSLRRHVLTHTGQKPFKCSQCPLLFTTKSNCDRHLLRKHGNVESASSIQIPIEEMPEPVKEPVNKSSNHVEEMTKNNIQSFNIPAALQIPQIKNENNMPHPIQTASNTVTSSDLPFKCHLCDGSFSDRVGCLEHIKVIHTQDFAILMSKVTLETDPEVQGSPDDDDGINHNANDNKSGKYPDYANRKVICAFCLRRFWSTEDLRRHMRTHSGERPFQCDICLRKFTLKHSMLRHRKKHSGAQNVNPMSFHAMKSPNGETNGNSGSLNINHSASDMSDDEQMTFNTNQKKLMKIMPDMIPINFLSQINQHLMNNRINNDKNNNSNNNNNENQSDNIDEKPMANNIQAALNAAFLSTLQQQFRDGEGGSELIGNLLGINDQGILNKVFMSTADEAAKLLGVDK